MCRRLRPVFRSPSHPAFLPAMSLCFNGRQDVCLLVFEGNFQQYFPRGCRQLIVTAFGYFQCSIVITFSRSA